jgi:hypothetical protein
MLNLLERHLWKHQIHFASVTLSKQPAQVSNNHFQSVATTSMSVDKLTCKALFCDFDNAGELSKCYVLSHQATCNNDFAMAYLTFGVPALSIVKKHKQYKCFITWGQQFIHCNGVTSFQTIKTLMIFRFST